MASLQEALPANPERVFDYRVFIRLGKDAEHHRVCVSNLSWLIIYMPSFNTF